VSGVKVLACHETLPAAEESQITDLEERFRWKEYERRGWRGKQRIITMLNGSRSWGRERAIITKILRSSQKKRGKKSTQYDGRRQKVKCWKSEGKGRRKTWKRRGEVLRLWRTFKSEKPKALHI